MTPHMLTFNEPIVFGRLNKRYQRFFMEVELDSHEVVVAHTPNTGSMVGLLERHNRVMLTVSDDKKRRTKFTVQAIEVDGAWVGINTHIPNKLIQNSLSHPLLADLSDYDNLKMEVPFGENLRSRVDCHFFNSRTLLPPLYLEIKSVTMKIGDQAQFPDSVSVRALKHIEDLLFVKKQGLRAGLLFLVQRLDCTSFAPASPIHKAYADSLARAAQEGLIIKAFSAIINERGVALAQELPCVF